MSLINKMLNDLEKRDAFLEENNNTILDGLYSAYDLELEQKRKWYSASLPLISIFVVISIVTISNYLFLNNFVKLSFLSSADTNLYQQSTALNETKSKGKFESSILSEDVDININESNHFLKLDNNLLIEPSISVSKPDISNSLNKIEEIFFETNEKGFNLIMKMPGDIDYLVYGLDNPNRVVIEVNNAELDFLLEELKPIEPIVAIRYSINKENRFKLVLETDQPMVIRKTTSNNNNDLVIFMDYQWSNEIVKRNNNHSFDEGLDDIVNKQVELEKETVYKGEIVKIPINQDINAYAEKLFQQGYRDYKNGDISNSLKKLNMVLDQDAAHVNARSTLATILSRQGHIKLAYSILNEGLIQYPDQADWLKVYARLLLNDGKVLEAKEMLAQNSPALPTNVEYYALKAAILQKLNEHNGAAKIYRDLLQFNPMKSVWWMGLGISLESLKRYEDALYAYQKASTNTSLAHESRNFVNRRITQLSNLLKDEAT
jgi:Tfp pilus assembly protein PilF